MEALTAEELDGVNLLCTRPWVLIRIPPQVDSRTTCAHDGAPSRPGRFAGHCEQPQAVRGCINIAVRLLAHAEQLEVEIE